MCLHRSTHARLLAVRQESVFVAVSVCQCVSVSCVCVCHVCVHVHAREHGDKGTRRCEEASLCESSCLKNCH